MSGKTSASNQAMSFAVDRRNRTNLTEAEASQLGVSVKFAIVTIGGGRKTEISILVLYTQTN